MLETKGIAVVIAAFLLVILGLNNKRIYTVSLASGEPGSIKLDLKYFLLLTVFWLFAVSVTDSADISIYRWAYTERISHGKEPLFDIIQFFFHDQGWVFDKFKLVWISLITILLYTGIKRYCKVPAAVVALAIITALPGFITQMRSALVSAIFLNAFSLILSGRKKDRVLYCVIILLSAQIHIEAYSFLIFLLINPKENRVFRSIYYLFITAATLLSLFFSSHYGSLIYTIISALPIGGNAVTRVLSFFEGEGSHFRYAFFLVCKHLFLFILTDQACDLQMNSLSIVGGRINSEQEISMIREANSLMLFFLPITMFSASFERLFNCFCLIQYSVIFNVGQSKLSLFKKVIWPQSIQSIMVIGVFIITFIEWYFSPDDLIRVVNSIRW